MNVFPEAQVFLDAPYSVLLVGSRAAVGGRPPATDEQLASSGARAELTRLLIPNASALRARWIAGRSGLVAVLGDGPLSTWDRSELERSKSTRLNSSHG